MHPRVESLPPPRPDFERFVHVLRREPSDRIPLLELGIHPQVVDAVLDEPLPATDPRASVERNVRAYHRLGYDVMKASAIIPWGVERLHAGDRASPGSGEAERGWADEHEGPISTLDDVAGFKWPQPEEVDFRSLDFATDALPDGMGLIGFSGGVLEFSMDLVGMERLMLATALEPELVDAVVERVGRTVYRVFEEYCRRDAIKALWLGDDLGHKTGLLISPRLLERLVFPWYRRFAALAHEHGRPFLLHSCGNTAEVMGTLVEDVGIDAKHSFEDVIEPVESFIDRWGTKLAVLGGVDVHLLSVGDETAIRERMRAILEYAAPRCSYAAGSGNSIPDYVPVDHFLAMVETVHSFNEERSGGLH